MTQTTFMKALRFTSKWEGGYVNDRYDAGGETKYGISKRAYPDLDIENLTREEADAIYERDYWRKPKFHKLPAKVAIAAFDFGVNSGHKRAVKYLQRIVGAHDDGMLGPKTLAKVDSFKELITNWEAELVLMYLEERKKFVKRIVENNPSQKRFLKGWLNRINALKDLLTEES